MLRVSSSNWTRDVSEPRQDFPKGGIKEKIKVPADYSKLVPNSKMPGCCLLAESVTVLKKLPRY